MSFKLISLYITIEHITTEMMRKKY